MPVPVNMRVPVDTCTLINFLCIDRMDLIGRHPGSFIVTKDVNKEITHPKHRERTKRYKQALADGHISRESLTAEEMSLRGQISLGLRIHGKVLKATGIDIGERSIIALALNRNYTSLATDDQKTIKFVNRMNDIFHDVPGKRIGVLETPQIIVELIQRESLSVEDADTILWKWKGMPPCQWKNVQTIISFRELL